MKNKYKNIKEAYIIRIIGSVINIAFSSWCVHVNCQ